MAGMDKLVEQAKAHLDSGEQVISVVQGVYETKLMGKDTVRNGIFIATDKRLVFYAKKLLGYDMEVFPYENISSFEVSKNFMGHTISFFASGNKVSMKWINKGDVQEFVQQVRSRIGKKNTVPTETAATVEKHDYAEDLKKLAELRAAGIITEEEFQAKKAEILSRI